MSNHQSSLPLSTFWYGVVFLAGIYWGISFHSGAFGPSFAIILPPLICLGTSVVAGDRQRIIIGAITLYVNFLIGFSIGYMLAEVGIIRFHYDSQK